MVLERTCPPCSFGIGVDRKLVAKSQSLSCLILAGMDIETLQNKLPFFLLYIGTGLVISFFLTAWRRD